MVALGFVPWLGFGAEPSSGEYLPTRWTTTDGLPSDCITAILPARDGYLWVGTANGLVRFDGVRFLPFELTDGDNPTNAAITALCEDPSGELWIGTQKAGLFTLVRDRLTLVGKLRGINCLASQPGGVWIGTTNGLFDWKENRFARLAPTNGAPHLAILGIQAAPSGNIWVTTSLGLFQLQAGQLVAPQLEANSQGAGENYFGAYEDGQSNLWAFGDSFLVNLNLNRRFNYFNASNLVTTRVWSLLGTKDGTLWFGTSGRGLFRFANDEFSPIHMGDDELLRNVQVMSKDAEGNLWVGTHDGGLVRLKPADLRWLEFDGPVSALAEDAQGRLWVAADGDGLFMIHAAGAVKLPVDASLSAQNHVTSIAVGKRGGLWIGTWGAGMYLVDRYGLAHFTLKDGLPDNVITALYAGQDEGVFVGTKSGDICRFIGRDLYKWGTAPLNRSISALLHARDGTLWIGTDGTGLWKIKTKLSAVEPGPPELQNADIRALLQDEAGRIWIGTAAKGLACIDGPNTRVATIADGLPENNISRLVTDEQGNLWLGTDKTVCEISRSAAEAFAAGKRLAPLYPVSINERMPGFNGLASGPGALRTRNGMVWFAMGRRIAEVTPNPNQDKTRPAPAQIEEVLVDGQALRSPWDQSPLPAPVALPYPLRSLEIHFTALDLRAPEQLKFKHKLENYDEAWSAAESARSVRYGRLPPGHYHFNVMAGDARGGWNEQRAQFDFVVLSPFWLEPWFQALCILAGLGLIVFWARKISNRRLRGKLVNLQHEQAMERERSRIARDIHDELGAKLTKISFLGERLKGRFSSAPGLGSQIDSIAGTARSMIKSLDEIVWAVNPRNDTLEHLVSYLGQYAIQYFQNTPVECAVTMPDALPHVWLSAERRHNMFLAVKETLNNVLKHAQAAHVSVTMSLTDEVFEVVTEDNGRGFEIPKLKMPPAETAGAEPYHPGGNGLVNLQSRLREIGGQCLVTSQLGQGTKVQLQINLRNARVTHFN